MKLKCLGIFLITMLSGALSAQQFSKLSIPPAKEDMPSWASFLYSKPINLYRIDSAYKAFYQSNPLVKNEYTRYFKRLRQLHRHTIDPKGNIMEPSIEFWSNRTGIAKKGRSAQVWNPIPMETFWLANDQAQQDPCPWQVNVYAFDIAPSNHNILYVATETGGYFKTIDKGLHWTQIALNDRLGSAEALVIHPTDPQKLWATAGFNIYYSSDGGINWTTQYTQSNLYGNSLQIDPSNPLHLVAGTEQGIFYTQNGGTTWTNSLPGTCSDVQMHQANPQIVLALQYNTVSDIFECWKSTNGGQTFQKSSTGWPIGVTDGRGRMTSSAADPNRFYALLLTDQGPRLLRSNNAGVSWITQATGETTEMPLNNGQGYYDLDIIASPSDANQLIVATTTAYKSINGGSTFTAVGGYTGNFPIHPDIQEMRVAGGDSWIATDGGMSLSTDFFANTAQTSARNQGLNGSDLWGFDIGWSKDIAVGGRYHNGNTCWSENYSGRFLRMGGAEAPTGYINPVENQKAYFSDLGGRILPKTFTDQAKYFPIGKWPNESYYTMESGEMTWDPICYNTVFIGSGNSFMKSTNGGGSYSTLFSSPDDGAVLEHIEVARSNPQVMYVTQRSNSTYSGKIWRTIDGGINWTAVANTPGTSNGDRRVSQITVGGSNPMEIWVAYRAAGTGKKVFYSHDGGDTWANWSTSTIDGTVISDIVHQLGTDGGVYLGCNDGKLFYRNALMNDWMLYNDGMPASMNALLLKPFYRDKKLKYSGNMGIWEAPLFEESKLLAGPSVDRQSSYCVSDTFYFGDYSVQASGATLTWDFPGATFVSDIHSSLPKVVYPATGSYDVTLSITDGIQTNSKTIKSMVSILANECEVDTVAGKCIKLSTSGDYVESPPLNLQTNTITWTAWIRPEGDLASFTGLLFSGSGDACGINLMYNNQLGYHWAGSPGTYSWQGGPIVPVNQWSHIALVVTAGSTTVYLNGVPYTRTATHPLVLMDQPVLIGSDRGYTERNFKGLMDEVCLYNRSLSIDEIRLLMHLTKQNVGGFPLPDAQLAAYYQFNETDGAVFNKSRGGQAILHGDAVRTRSSVPVASGNSQSKLITNTGQFDLDSVGVQIQYDDVAQLPNGLVYVSRLNSLPDTLPTCTAWSYNRHYWILHNYGTEPNSSFSNIQFALPGLPDIANLPSESYQLLYRNAIADSLSWQDILPADVQLTADNISFEDVAASNGNQQLFVSSHLLDQQIAGPDTVCAGQMNSYWITTDPSGNYEWSLDNGLLEFGFNPAIALVTLSSQPAILSCTFNADGCSTVITKQLFLYPTQTPTLTFDGEFLSVQDQYDEYLWYLDDELITDATGAHWKVLQSGLYKIIVTDENGCQYETEMLVIIDKTKEQAKNWLRIYPNPGKDWIRIDDNQDLQKITCFNSTGMKLGDLEIENHRISIGKLAAGQYFIQVKTRTGELYYGKFVKQ